MFYYQAITQIAVTKLHYLLIFNKLKEQKITHKNIELNGNVTKH